MKQNQKFYETCWNDDKIIIEQKNHNIKVGELQLMIKKEVYKQREGIKEILQKKFEKKQNQIDSLLQEKITNNTGLYNYETRLATKEYINHKINCKVSKYESQLDKLYEQNKKLQKELHAKECQLMVLQLMNQPPKQDKQKKIPSFGYTFNVHDNTKTKNRGRMQIATKSPRKRMQIATKSPKHKKQKTL